MEQSINLREYLDILKRRRIIVILVMIICLGLGGYKTYVNYESYVPTYRSSVTVRINSTKNVKKKKKDDTTTNQLDPYSTYNISLNQNIDSTYASLAESNNVRNLVASSLKVSAAELGTIKATVREDIAEFIDITVINKSPEMAQKVVKKIPSAFNEELIRLMGIDCVQVVYEASDPALIERGKDLTILKAAGVGVVLSIFLVLLAECLDTKIVTPDDINKYWNYQLIGTIPLDRSNSKGKRRTKK